MTSSGNTFKPVRINGDGTISEEPVELENHFILRLPSVTDAARNVRQYLQEGEEKFKDKLQINFNQDMRHAQVKVDSEIFNGTLMDLPCIIESLKTIDRKNFYKVTDISQILICKREGEEQDDIFKPTKQKSAPRQQQQVDKDDSDDPKKKDKQYHYPHGIAPPLKNVRKRRFRKTLKKKYMDAPELEKELKRLLRTDLEAVSVRWEVVTPEQEAQQKLDRRNSSSVNTLNPADRNLSEYGSSASNLIREHDIFGGALSSSSSEDEETAEGREMAQQLMMTNNDQSFDNGNSRATNLTSTLSQDLDSVAHASGNIHAMMGGGSGMDSDTASVTNVSFDLDSI